MTRAVQDRILKDMNGDTSDHLRNHIHLTNCIHLKNHMHKHSPILGDRALMRDLVVLQRSRSLRDPSASPPSVLDVLFKRGERDGLANGRQSFGVERFGECGRMSGSSPPVTGSPGPKLGAAQVSRRNDRAATAVSHHSSKDGVRESRRAMREETSGKSEMRDYRQDRFLKTLSDQLKHMPTESDDAALSRNHDERHNSQVEKNAEANIRRHGNSLNRGRRRKFRGARRNRPSIAAREAETQNEMSVASNSFAQGKAPQKYRMEEEALEYDDHNVTGGPKNGCGIPWNWSRLHDRGKSFLDIAGRSISCGLSESRLKKGISDMPVKSEHSSSSTRSDGETLPLLLEASGSQGSIDRAAWLNDYSGELGIYAENLLKQEIDSDLASEGRSREQHRFTRQHNDRHQNLTQKYIPRTFRDLVGQNLVTQALSNAIVKRKVGLLYVFYGPHGTGKTACARVFARALNCQSRDSPRPCGYCDSCIAHDMGKSRNVREIGPVSNIDFESIIQLFDSMTVSQPHSQYKVFIFDECDTLSSDCWSAILKVIDRAPRRVVFVLVCSSLDVLPHVIISRCQKFFFPKLKDADIVHTLHLIATKEDLEIDKDALKLIASRSDGSLRDAEMTLEQLSLLGQRISLCLVQELVGLISDEKLVDLLDLALSADTVNTVKNLRDIMESGVEPLALMSQLATVITDILAGSYDIMKERPRRKFFRRQALSKEDMEKLRQALKTLSEAEKQLRVSNDRMTWLTAALLQLAPDQQYMLPGSSADTSLNHSPVVLNNTVLRERPRKSNAEMPNLGAGYNGDVYYNAKLKGSVGMDGKGHLGGRQVYSASNNKNQMNQEIEEIWLEVLEKIPINTIKEFMYQEAKLISLSYNTAPSVQLLFNSQVAKSKAEKFRLHILQAFESVLRSPVAIEIRCESRKDVETRPILLPASKGPSLSDVNPVSLTNDGTPMTGHSDIRRIKNRDTSSGGVTRSEIVEIAASPSDQRNLGDSNPNLSLVRRKVSLAHVIQQADRCSEYSGWSKRKAVSIAEKLEQENLTRDYCGFCETGIEITEIALLEPSKNYTPKAFTFENKNKETANFAEIRFVWKVSVR
ncbi:hypothetical protein BUALT_Bualt03G0038700 [Buddleja alternifolia]|uniref:AAA+ ATPase domain-containing protein n=1 Tax=Buddleja alternifolia TaxID=168488 RepID=A0AAV6XXQ7_9LAMI|nr:hypothetical protein BUALT_Bualt03G0038700 [Buddleja alternifolia]